MQEKLQKQISGEEYSFHNLNTLCWAIGAISGCLLEAEEKRFLVIIIRELLQLCTQQRGKNHKVVIASNIMYVVGQYPRFLRSHWHFLKVVIFKLFEFMREKHQGVQDMSCDTFLKISKRCKQQFLKIVDNYCLLDAILDTIADTVQYLSAQQVNIFYTSCAEIITAESDYHKKQQWIYKLMNIPNMLWSQIMLQQQHDSLTLLGRSSSSSSGASSANGGQKSSEVLSQLKLILQTNNCVAQSLQSFYIIQLSRIYNEMIQIYALYHAYLKEEILKQNNLQILQMLPYNQMLAIRKQMVLILKNYTKNMKQEQISNFMKHMFPTFLSTILASYSDNGGLPQNGAGYQNSNLTLKEVEIINLTSQIIQSCHQMLTKEHLSLFIQQIIPSTLSLIQNNFKDFPTHRISLFSLIQILISTASIFIKIPIDSYKLLIDCIIYSMNHIDVHVAKIGGETLLLLLKKVAHNMFQYKDQFYLSFYQNLINQTLSVLCDHLHHFNMELHTKILTHLFYQIEQGNITVCLYAG